MEATQGVFGAQLPDGQVAPDQPGPVPAEMRRDEWISGSEEGFRSPAILSRTLISASEEGSYLRRMNVCITQL